VNCAKTAQGIQLLMHSAYTQIALQCIISGYLLKQNITAFPPQGNLELGCFYFFVTYGCYQANIESATIKAVDDNRTLFTALECHYCKKRCCSTSVLSLPNVSGIT